MAGGHRYDKIGMARLGREGDVHIRLENPETNQIIRLDAEAARDLVQRLSTILPTTGRPPLPFVVTVERVLLDAAAPGMAPPVCSTAELGLLQFRWEGESQARMALALAAASANKPN